jgi:hypothetical protein
MSIRTFVRWVSVFVVACPAPVVVASCGNSSQSLFDASADGSLGFDAPLPPPADNASPPVDLDAFTGCVPKTCPALGYNCGMNGDGCGGLLDCGPCPNGQFCGGSGYSRCGTGMGDGGADGGSGCAPLTCQALSVNCGKQGDGCGGVLDCGGCPTGQFCGGGGFNLCGLGKATDGAAVMPCTPLTCAAKGWDCGQAGDGCGGSIQCGSGTTCPGTEYCGGGGFNKCGGMKPPVLPDGAPGLPCTPLTCATQGFNCGPAGDGCGNLLSSCGTCSGTDICGGGGMPGVCGNRTPCTGLCLQQMQCDGGTTTTVTGTVRAGASAWTGLTPDPVPNVLVYVRNAPLQPFNQTLQCRSCDADVSGSPLVSTYTKFDGTFTLTNVPVGSAIPFVIQLGRWRRQFTFNVPACTTTSIGTLNMPRNQSEGNIPFTAISTGDVDPLECVLLKMGIDQAEFTADSGTGRVQIYGGGPLNGGSGPGSTAPGGTTRQEASLLDTGGTFMNYDQIMLPCWGAPYTKTANELANLVTYSDSGGHFFATHYSYSWLVNNGEFNNVANWNPDYNNPGIVTWTLNVSTQVPPANPGLFAEWLNFIGALSNSGPTVPANPQVAITNPRHDADGVANGSVDWIDGTDPQHNNSLVEHFTFNTPVGATSLCGHDIFSDFHVASIANGGPACPPTCNTNGQVFPNECTTDFSPQEKILEYMIWDLASCPPAPPPPNCNKISCGSVMCGPASDGCGGLQNCGICPPGQQCGVGTMHGKCYPIPEGGSCTPLSCGAQNFNCGLQGDGCGGSQNCGTCPAGQTCGGCGVPGQCCGTGCTPRTCAAQNINCGPAGDGCGNLLDCGSCPAGQTCGGGGVPGQCGGCKPQTCAQLGIECGPAGDGCGNLLQCGDCPSPTTCGGSGVYGKCGGPAK